MKIQPIGENVLIVPENIAEKTEGGFYIPESIDKPVLFGIIAGVGMDCPEELKEGQKIAYAKYSSNASEIGEYILINWHDIQGIIFEE